MRGSWSTRSGLAAVATAVVVGPGAVAMTSGLQGFVRVGPTMPVCKVGEPCSRAVKTTLVFTRLGRRILVRTGADGAYRALLPAGIYEVTTSPKIGLGVIKPTRVKVRLGHVDHLDFFADTGIR
jgi:hypothetical protein